MRFLKLLCSLPTSQSEEGHTPRSLTPKFCLYFFIFENFLDHTMRHVGSSFPDQGLNQQPLHWEGGVLTTEPGKSPLSALSNAGLGFCLTPPRSPLAGTEMWAWPSCLGPVASLNHGLSPGASEALLTRTDRRRVLEGRAVSHSGSVWARPPDVTPCMSRGPPTCVSLP